MKVNIVVITLQSKKNISQWGVPFYFKSEANKYALKLQTYYKKTDFKVRVTVQNSMPVRIRVEKDWRKAGIT